MKKNSIVKKDDCYLRILSLRDNEALAIDCISKTMPKWYLLSEFEYFQEVSEQELFKNLNINLQDIETLSPENKRVAYEKYTLIAAVLPFICDKSEQNKVISKISEDKNISKQTIRKYLCTYLVYQNISALAPSKKNKEKKLSKDEKNMRWALNKFFYCEA